MITRTQLRVVPETDRYFTVDIPDQGPFHFRFPSYGKAATLVGLLQGLEQGDGLEKLVGLLDVAGYTIGVCWFNKAFDLDAGKPPRSSDGDAWAAYGDAVVDDLQEEGLTLPAVMLMVNTIITQLAENLSEVSEAQEAAGN